MKRLYCPQYLTLHPRSPSHRLSHRRPLRRSLSFSAPDSHSDSCAPTECAAGVTTFNASELSSADDAGVFNDEGNMFSARSRTTPHQRSSFFAYKGQPSRSQLAEIILVEHKQVGLTVNPIILKDCCRWTQPVLLQHRQPTVFLFLHFQHLFTQLEFQKKRGKNEKIPFFSFWTGFYFLSVTGPFKTLNRLCSNNSAFQVDRGVSEGFSVELARDRTW